MTTVDLFVIRYSLHSLVFKQNTYDYTETGIKDSTRSIVQNAATPPMP